MTTKFYWMVIHYVIKDTSKFGVVDFYNIAVIDKPVANLPHFWPFRGKSHYKPTAQLKLYVILVQIMCNSLNSTFT